LKASKQDGLNRENAMVYFPDNLKCTKLVLNMLGNFNVSQENKHQECGRASISGIAGAEAAKFKMAGK